MSYVILSYGKNNEFFKNVSREKSMAIRYQVHILFNYKRKVYIGLLK